MRTTLLLMLVMGLISLSACVNVSGNVVPEEGPTMEQVYDSMETENRTENTTENRKENRIENGTENTTKNTTKKIKADHTNRQATLPLNAADSEFHKIPNPELTMYVYPHLAGKDEMPVPGYDTAFNAYTQDHYVLPNEL